MSDSVEYGYHPFLAMLLGQRKPSPDAERRARCSCCSDPSHMTYCSSHDPKPCPPCEIHGDANKYSAYPLSERAEWVAYQCARGVDIAPDWAAHETEFAAMEASIAELRKATQHMDAMDQVKWAYGDAAQRAAIEAKYPKGAA